MCYCIVQLLDACTSRLDLNSAARRLFTLDGDEVCNSCFLCITLNTAFS